MPVAIASENELFYTIIDLMSLLLPCLKIMLHDVVDSPSTIFKVYELHIPTGEGAPAFSKCLQVLHQLALEVFFPVLHPTRFYRARKNLLWLDVHPNHIVGAAV